MNSRLAAVLTSLFLAACGSGGGGDGYPDAGGSGLDASCDADTDSDTDADTDADTDTDTDTDTDGDTETDSDTSTSSSTSTGSTDPDTDTGEDAGSDAGHDAGTPLVCNGSAAYCDRPYNQVAQVCTHNSMSNTADWPLAVPTPNQEHSFTRQLDDGVRCMMLDTFMNLGRPTLCHANCLLGSTLWVPMLRNLATWLEENPGEVVTFILEANITEEETRQALENGEVWELVYHHDAPPGSPWPTLREMIDANQRLVVFTDDGSANGQWHLHWSSYGWETPYDDPTFTCEDGRGTPAAYDNQVFILNHYTLCTLGGCASNGVTNNAYDFMLPRAESCWEVDPIWNPWGQIPTFVNVDHYQVPAPGAASPRADVFDTVDALNAAWTE